MDRLTLWRPRATHRRWTPLSGLITLDVHWHNRTWACGGEQCRLCHLVPTREVCYFAARVQIAQETPQLVLLERSSAFIREVLRRTGLNWDETIGRLTIWEETEGRSITLDRWASRTEGISESVSMPLLGFSVARLHRAPHFPECHSPGEIRRCLESYSARIQSLSLSGATEVH